MRDFTSPAHKLFALTKCRHRCVDELLCYLFGYYGYGLSLQLFRHSKPVFSYESAFTGIITHVPCTLLPKLTYLTF